MSDALAYYATPGVHTDPGPHAAMLDDLPADVEGLARVVQGLLVHVFWAERYGLELSPEREGEVGLRRVDRQLARIAALDGRPLTEARPLETRLVGNCRDHAVMLCALLRHQGVPARARCGFGAYFTPGKREDHWVCEVWREDAGLATGGGAAAGGGWVLVDAQLDALQCEALRIGFDPLDVPRDQFITAGDAWLDCRARRADPLNHGILDMHGWGFIYGNVVRDLLALRKVELLPWDGWFDVDPSAQRLPEEMVAWTDRIAEATSRAGRTSDPARELEAVLALDDALAALGMPPGWLPEG